MRKATRVFQIALVCALVLTACSAAPSWLEGSWTVDQDRTQKEIDATSKADSGGGFNMLSGLSNMLGNMLLPKLQGMQVIVNGHERIVTINGQGSSDSYQVVSRTADQCVMKFKDGKIETYYRDGDEIYVYPEGDAHFKIYLKRQN